MLINPAVLQAAMSGLTDEAYTNAKKISGTGLVGSDPQIDVNTETFIGQIRWWQPLNAKVNIQSLTDATEGQRTTTSQAMLKYVKSARSHGAQQVNVEQVITQQDGLQKIARDFVETRTQDESNALQAVLRGVMISELLRGTGAAGTGGQTFDNDPTDAKCGFYVDLGAEQFMAAPAAGMIGAQRATAILEAVGMAYKEYEPAYFYLLANPEMMSQLRSANLIDEDRVTDGSVEFSTIFQGKFRLVQTRANLGLSAAEITKLNTGAGVDIVGKKVALVVTPGALKYASLAMPLPFEIERKAAVYGGAGTTDMWYRWGHIIHPQGYTWQGSEERFASDADYEGLVKADGTTVKLDAADLAATKSTWARKYTSVLTLGILPVLYGGVKP